MLYPSLIFEFSKIGLFAVGGGLAVLPFLYQFDGHTAWFHTDELPRMLAIAQLLPGAIGVNLAALCGAHVSTLGAYTAVFAMIMPQIIIILGASRMMNTLEHSEAARRIFAGMVPAATGLVAAAALRMIYPLLMQNNSGDSAAMIQIREVLLFFTFFLIIRTIRAARGIVVIALAAALGIIFQLES
ncbi:MAG: chromate transporter [Spirochaetaceae bacterium]|jgi:chromate transporter|nr:chromate transporter [Spirochaetaceae bacterium]